MTISVLSQYLFHVISKLPSHKHNDFLRIVYLIEAVDYHKRNLDFAQKLEPSEAGWMRGALQPPEDWKTSIDIKEPSQIAHYWSYLVSIIEFEAFLTTIVRLSDVAFTLLNQEMMKAAIEAQVLTKREAKYVKNIRDYCDKKNKPKYSFLQKSTYNKILEQAWKDWLEDLTNLRNLIVHKIPFGGRTWSGGQIPIDGGLYSVLFLPEFSEIKNSA